MQNSYSMARLTGFVLTLHLFQVSDSVKSSDCECCAELTLCINIQYCTLILVCEQCFSGNGRLHVFLIQPLVVIVLWLCFPVQHRALYPNLLELCLVCIATLVYHTYITHILYSHSVFMWSLSSDCCSLGDPLAFLFFCHHNV